MSSAFDPNVSVLPASREERRRLAHAGTTAPPTTAPGEKRKAHLEETRDDVLKELAMYRAPADLSVMLNSSAVHSRRAKRVKKLTRQDQMSTEEEQTNDDTTQNSNDDKRYVAAAFEEVVLDTVVDIADPSPLEDHPFQFKMREETADDDEAATTAVVQKRSSDWRSDVHLFTRGIEMRRSIEIERQRAQLPAVAMEQELVDLIIQNDISLITGATGCGKSTQVPQFLYESGLCSSKDLIIGITQPRRVAAVALARRVEEELNLPRLVGHQVRYDKSATPDCRLKFMTDGILLKEVQADFLCSKYSVIIIDEAHERSVNCDILVGLLSRSVRLRRQRFNAATTAADTTNCLPPLRLVIMSATLQLTDFTENALLFPEPPPALHITGRSHPVTLHFSRRTCANSTKQAAAKAVEIHRNLPAGSILVFVTGRREVHEACRDIRSRLQDRGDSSEDVHGITYHSNRTDGTQATDIPPHITLLDDEDGEISEDEHLSDDEEVVEVVEDLGTARGGNLAIRGSLDESSAMFMLDGDEEKTFTKILSEENQSTVPCEGELFEKVGPSDDCPSAALQDEATALGFDCGEGMGRLNPKAAADTYRWLGGDRISASDCVVKIIPLYALLSTKEQKKAFNPPNPGERIIVVATNVAETSLTLPNIRYVVDTGLEKKRRFISGDNNSVFTTQWISKASADQRAGRAGRLGAGHCYRLYSTAMYTHVFPAFPTINLFLCPMDAVVLFMASIGIPDVQKFPFPTPPIVKSVQAAQHLLGCLGALDSNSMYAITPLGRLMSQLPVSPRFAVVLIAASARSRSCSTEADQGLISACCCVSAALTVGGVTDDDGPRPVQFDTDIDLLLWVMSGYISSPDKEYFCSVNKVNQRQVSEAAELVDQLGKILCNKIPSVGKFRDLKKFPLEVNSALSLAVQDCMLLGHIDNIVVRGDLLPAVGTPSSSRSAYFWSDQSTEIAGGRHGKIYVHNSSQVHKLRPRPALICFAHILTTTITSDESKTEQHKRFIRHCFPVDPVILAKVDSPLVKHSEFLSSPKPSYSTTEDNVVGFVEAKYTLMNFALPSITKPLPENDLVKYVIFAEAFCEGQVFHYLQKFHCKKISYLRADPVILSGVIKFGQHGDHSHLKSIPPIFMPFIEALIQAKCSTKQTTIAIWQSNKEFLLSEYEALIHRSPRKMLKELRGAWPLS